MASLARSLLALAVLALLQAACAFHLDSIPSNDPLFGGRHRACKTYLFGRRTDNSNMIYTLPRIYLSQVDNHVDIHDPRDYGIGTELVGEEVQACDRDFSEAPDVKQSVPGSFKYLEVVAKGLCRQSPVNIELRVTRYRKVAGRPSNESD